MVLIVKWHPASDTHALPQRRQGVPPQITPMQAARTLRVWRGDPDIALDVWVTKEQEGFAGERVLCHLLWLCNPDTQSSVWATPPPHAKTLAAQSDRQWHPKSLLIRLRGLTASAIRRWI